LKYILKVIDPTLDTGGVILDLRNTFINIETLPESNAWFTKPVIAGD